LDVKWGINVHPIHDDVQISILSEIYNLARKISVAHLRIPHQGRNAITFACHYVEKCCGS
jgi:hypothetical protein